MVREGKGPLKVFLCHASGDKPPVRDLYKRLTVEGVDAWLDKEKLLPGQDWRLEIPRAVRDADVVVICLSNRSITKEGYVQKEIRFALDIAEEKPEGTIFLIPARLEECTVPERLNRWQWVDLYEDDGFIKLLRSLKLRADAVGATVEPDLYVDSAKETDLRLEQLYTEGLAAFYTEDWDRACRSFQSILSERPNHKNAAEKLEEAGRQRNLSKLYEQAVGAVRSEDWGTAIQILEELSTKSADYKDTAQLLRDARKQKQLRDLYAEAKALHAGKQWEAVVRVFEQISSIDPNYPDADGLLPSAQKEVAELKRLAELNEQYSQALREMDAGNWHEARRLLESVHKSETGFLETEKLLKKVENEIVKEDERRKQNDQINTLYEQAHGLLRSKKWRNALDKIEEIRKLDEHFPDTDGIAEKAQKELAREDREAERQNKLAALYAEAVKLLKEEKYQEALDKWGEVKAIDPKYPDRQWVRRIAKKALAKQAKPISAKPKFVMPKSLWIGLGGIVTIVILALAINQFGKGENKASLATTTVSTDIVVENNVLPVSTVTNVPQKTSTPRPATPVPTSGGYSDPTIYDGFTDAQYDGSYNKSKWSIWRSTGSGGQFVQENGEFTINMGSNNGVDITLAKYQSYIISKPTFIEAKIMLDSAKSTNNLGVSIEVSSKNPNIGQSACFISNNKNSEMQTLSCGNNYHGKYQEFLSSKNLNADWHIIRIEVDPSKAQVDYYVDGLRSETYVLSDASELGEARFRFLIEMGRENSDNTSSDGYIDYVRVGAIEDDPNILVYDGFDNTKFDNGYNNEIWDTLTSNSMGEIIQNDGILELTQSGKEVGRGLTLKKTIVAKANLSNKVVGFQADMMVDKVNNTGVVEFHINTTSRLVLCQLRSWGSGCIAERDGKVINISNSNAQLGDWYTLTINLDLISDVAHIYFNEKQVGSINLDKNESLSGVSLVVYSFTEQPATGYFDNVRIMILEQP